MAETDEQKGERALAKANELLDVLIPAKDTGVDFGNIAMVLGLLVGCVGKISDRPDFFSMVGNVAQGIVDGTLLLPE